MVLLALGWLLTLHAQTLTWSNYQNPNATQIVIWRTNAGKLFFVTNVPPTRTNVVLSPKWPIGTVFVASGSGPTGNPAPVKAK